MNIPKYCKISLTPSASINNISIFPYFDNWMRSTCHCSGHVFWRRRINQGPSSIRRHAAIGQRTRRTHTLDTAAVSTQFVLPHGDIIRRGCWVLGHSNQELSINMVCLMMAPENCIGGWLSPAAILTGHNQTQAADHEWNGSLYLGLDIRCIDIHYLDMDTYSEWFREVIWRPVIVCTPAPAGADTSVCLRCYSRRVSIVSL